MSHDDTPRPLDLAQVRARLTTGYVGREIVYRARLGSTNDLAQELARQRAREGTLVIADEQTAGRGRLGRQWLSPPCTNLLMSLLFYPPLAPAQAQRMTMVCALAVADALQCVAGVRADIKWPNDILLRGKKVAGVLTELGLQGDALAYTVVGIGLNVNLSASQMPAPLRQAATSAAIEKGEPVSREALLAAILNGVERRYERLRQGESPVAEWSARLATLGRRVCVTDMSGDASTAASWEGRAERVDDDGALWLRLDDGTPHRVLAGDVSLREH